MRHSLHPNFLQMFACKFSRSFSQLSYALSHIRLVAPAAANVPYCPRWKPELVSFKFSTSCCQKAESAAAATTTPNAVEPSVVDEDDALIDANTASVNVQIQELARTPADSKDRSRDIPWEVSARYLKSSAFAKTYRGLLVWQPYVRNFKGQRLPHTRATCIRFRKLVNNNPCPICRDEYLVVDHRNTELLRQFISPHTGKILSSKQTQLCQRKHKLMEAEIEMARDLGTIPHETIHRHYDYSIYYEPQKTSKTRTVEASKASRSVGVEKTMQIM